MYHNTLSNLRKRSQTGLSNIAYHSGDAFFLVFRVLAHYSVLLSNLAELYRAATKNGIKFILKHLYEQSYRECLKSANVGSLRHASITLMGMRPKAVMFHLGIFNLRFGTIP